LLFPSVLHFYYLLKIHVIIAIFEMKPVILQHHRKRMQPKAEIRIVQLAPRIFCNRWRNYYYIIDKCMFQWEIPMYNFFVLFVNSFCLENNIFLERLIYILYGWMQIVESCISKSFVMFFIIKMQNIFIRIVNIINTYKLLQILYNIKT